VVVVVVDETKLGVDDGVVMGQKPKRMGAIFERQK
jgi:hypothetical protein